MLKIKPSSRQSLACILWKIQIQVSFSLLAYFIQKVDINSKNVWHLEINVFVNQIAKKYRQWFYELIIWLIEM